jgi:hypothetical protein
MGLVRDVEWEITEDRARVKPFWGKDAVREIKVRTGAAEYYADELRRILSGDSREVFVPSLPSRRKTSKQDQLRALARICRQLGGQLKIVTERDVHAMIDRDWPDYDNHESFEEAEAGFDLETHEGFSSPENSDAHGLEWKKKIVYAVRGRENVSQIIHEMGHVFADRHAPESSKADEWSWFGWEMTIACRISAWQAWSKHNGGYRLGKGVTGGVGKDKDWYDLTAGESRAIYFDRVAYAKQIGIVAADGTPRSVR